jgi:hypothetical protein
MNEIIQEEGYKIYCITDDKYMGESYSFIANYKNAHDKLLFYRRHSAYKDRSYEIHKFTIEKISIVKIVE